MQNADKKLHELINVKSNAKKFEKVYLKTQKQIFATVDQHQKCQNDSKFFCWF